MKTLKKILAALSVLAVLLIAVFLSGRYGWKLGGFQLCETAGIEQVQVEENLVRLRGFDPGSFPRGFLGYHSEQNGQTLYVGFKFSALFGIFETGDFDITIPTQGTVTEIIVKTAENEYSLWPEETHFNHNPEAAENGIYILLEREDVYSVNWYFENQSGGMSPADGTALEANKTIFLLDDVFPAASNLERPIPVMLRFCDKDGLPIAQVSLSYDPLSPVLTVTLTADGRICLNGLEVEQTALPEAYEGILERYRIALAEGWSGQQFVDAGLSLMLLDVPGDTVGYATEDLNGDGVPELLLGTLSGDDFYGKLIFALYTLDDSCQPLSLFVSTHRDRWYYAGGNRFVNVGSSGASSSFDTTLKLEGAELIDMTFTTDPKDYVQPTLIPLSRHEGLAEALYIGEYLDQDNNEPNLEIAKGEDGKYIVQIGIFRLTTLDDGVGTLTPEGMEFTAADSAGNPIHGIITVENRVATVTFTDSTWPLLENGSAYTYTKSSDTPNIWTESE